MLDLSLLDSTILGIRLEVWLVLIALLITANLGTRLLVAGIVRLVGRPGPDGKPPRPLLLKNPLALLVTFVVAGFGTLFLDLQGFTLIFLRWVLLALIVGSLLWLLVRLYFVLTERRYNTPEALIFTRALYLGFSVVASFVLLILYIQYPIRCVPNCVGADLRSTELSNLNLSETDFLEANLISSNLSGTNLSGSDFSGARMAAANLQDTNLANTRFTGADLRGVDLRNANLRGADFTGARLDRVDMTDNDLTETLLHGAILDEAVLVRVNLANAELRGVSMINATMTSADLSDANLVGAIMSGSDISGAMLDGADLSGAWLNLVDLSNSSLQDTTLRGAYLIGSRLPSTNLRSTSMEGAVLLGVNLGGADLVGANLTGIRIFPSEFLNQGVISADPVLSELNELARSRILSTVRMNGVIFDQTTVWPPSKQLLLLDRLDSQAVDNAETGEDAGPEDVMTTSALESIEAQDGLTEATVFQIANPDIAGLTGNIIGDGSALVFPLSQSLANDFDQMGFGGQLFVQESNTTNGFDLLCNRGAVDFVYATRYITNAEREACLTQGRQPLVIRVGTIEALAFIVSPSNTYIDNLNENDLREALTLQRWTDVNSNYPPDEIYRYLPAPDTPAYDLIVEQILDGDDQLLLDQSNTVFDTSDANLVWELLSGDASGFAIVDFRYFLENRSLVRGVRLADAQPNVQGIEGTRYPLSRPVLIYADLNALQNNYHIVAFLSHYLNNVADIIADFGFSPLLPQNYAREKNNFLLALAGTR